MMRWLLPLLLAGCSATAEPTADPPTEMADSVEAVVTGKACTTGCASAHPMEPIGTLEIDRLLAAVAKQPIGEPSIELETLLFHGLEVMGHDEVLGLAPLTNAQARWLRTELSRQQVDIKLELIGSDGTVLGHRTDRIPLVEKQHLLLLETGDLGGLSINGKVKRVGVKHLWARF